MGKWEDVEKISSCELCLIDGVRGSRIQPGVSGFTHRKEPYELCFLCRRLHTSNAIESPTAYSEDRTAIVKEVALMLHTVLAEIRGMVDSGKEAGT